MIKVEYEKPYPPDLEKIPDGCCAVYYYEDCLDFHPDKILQSYSHPPFTVKIETLNEADRQELSRIGYVRSNKCENWECFEGEDFEEINPPTRPRACDCGSPVCEYPGS
jgi:hypothetical protein